MSKKAKRSWIVRWTDGKDGQAKMRCFDRREPAENHAHKMRRTTRQAVKIETYNERFQMVKAMYVNE